MTWRRIASGVGAVVAAGVVLAGCGSDSQESAAGSAASARATAAPGRRNFRHSPPVPADAVMTLVTNEGTIEIAMDPAARSD